MSDDRKISGGYKMPEPIDYDKPVGRLYPFIAEDGEVITEQPVGGLHPYYTMPPDDPRQTYFIEHDESSVKAEFGKNTFRLLRGMGTQALFSVFSAVRYVGEFAVAVVAVPIYDFGKHVYRKFWEGRP